MSVILIIENNLIKIFIPTLNYFIRKLKPTKHLFHNGCLLVVLNIHFYKCKNITVLKKIITIYYSKKQHKLSNTIKLNFNKLFTVFLSILLNYLSKSLLLSFFFLHIITPYSKFINNNIQ